MSVISTDFNHFILTGDFNIHIDNMTDGNAKEFSSVLDMFGLWQHVTEPTHLRGHTLDLVISKGVVDISSVVVIDLALSDHFCILSDLLITQNVQTTSFSVKKRYINEKTSAQFREAIAMSPTMSAQSVDGLLDHFNLRILNVMEAVALDDTSVIIVGRIPSIFSLIETLCICLMLHSASNMPTL